MATSSFGREQAQRSPAETALSMGGGRNRGAVSGWYSDLSLLLKMLVAFGLICLLIFWADGVRLPHHD